MEEERYTEMPELVIGGRRIHPPPPKMRVWREFMAFFDQDKGEMSVEDFLDAHVNLIVLAFHRPEVTKSSVEDALEIAEVIPLTREIFRWLQAQIFSRLVNLQNGEAGAGEA
ncbi:MAG: hypothetical protein IKH16_04850 [Selenomonadaceae bacterium]|nr:hypothetical protein [Selenomonadaceae bacterium]